MLTVRVSIVNRVNQGHWRARCALRSGMLRIGQQCIPRLRGLSQHHSAAVIIVLHNETRRCRAAQERNLDPLGTIREQQRTPSIVAIR